MKNTASLLDILDSRILIADGAMGTMIQRANPSDRDFGGYPGCNEYLCVTKPDIVANIHSAYLDAGADIIETNTFGATPVVLEEYGLEARSEEINTAAAKIARKCANDFSTGSKPRFVAGSMGPTTKSIFVTASATFDDLAENYLIQSKGLITGGVDFLLLETAHDMLNIKAGLTGINEAFAMLGDETRRSNYDRFGTAGEDFQGFQNGGFEGFGGFEDIFDSFFGGDIFGGRSKRNRRGADLKYEMELDFEEAAFGIKQDIELTRLVDCEDCKGTGADNGKMATCTACNGKGKKKNSIRTPFGIIAQMTTCNSCRGHGNIPEKECRTCSGQGRKKHKRKVTVKIPAGVDNGSTLRVSGEGDAGEAGNGDLYVELFVKPHKVFEREGNHVLLTVPISFSQAALGLEIDIPTLKGDTTLKIPAGTQSHIIFRMRGKGIPDVHTGSVGDQLVKIIVRTPTSLSKKHKEILEELAEKKENMEPEKDFFTKFKEKFV